MPLLSQSSPRAAFVVPSPHAAKVQSASQAILSPAASHSSPVAGLVKPSPHEGNVQSESHATSFPPPVSHCSPAVALTIWSPHCCSVQLALQFALSVPSSHCSPASTSTRLLPQVSLDWQSARQPSPDTLLPSSQNSPLSMEPLPQLSSRQFWLHPSPPSKLPSSHASLRAVSSSPLPQVSLERQSARQPSPDTLLPSSQTSSGSRVPLPQVVLAKQSAVQLSSLRTLPSSQISPGSTTPFPQVPMIHAVPSKVHWVPTGQRSPVWAQTVVSVSKQALRETRAHAANTAASHGPAYGRLTMRYPNKLIFVILRSQY